MEQKQAGSTPRRAGDLIIERYMKGCSREERDEARESLRAFAQVLARTGDKVLEEREPTSSNLDERGTVENMRKKRPNDFEVYARDGWVRIPPGGQVAFSVDTLVKPSKAEQDELMRHLRGSILASGFDIEDRLVRIQLFDAFGTLDPSQGGADFVAKEREIRRSPELKRKIEGARPAIRRLLDIKVADRLMQDLADFRRVRNTIAHRAAWQEGVWDPDAGTDESAPKGRTVSMRLFIADEDFIWEIDGAQITEWNQLFVRCMSGLDAVEAHFIDPAQPPT